MKSLKKCLLNWFSAREYKFNSTKIDLKLKAIVNNKEIEDQKVLKLFIIVKNKAI